jgi:hypothetical protein
MPKKELHFSIEGTTPHTFPMARLAEYLRELAKLLGSEDCFHFLRVDEGSANCAMEIDSEQEHSVAERVRQAQSEQLDKMREKELTPEQFDNSRLFLD